MPNLVRIGYHYYGQDVDFTDYDRTARSVLPQEVNPGETVTIDVLINDIKNEGTYVIQIDPVMEEQYCRKQFLVLVKGCFYA